VVCPDLYTFVEMALLLVVIDANYFRIPVLLIDVCVAVLVTVTDAL